MGVGQLRRLYDLLKAGSRLAIADVMGDCLVEEDGFLGDNADLGP
jgi:hypothetical protein